MIFLLIIFGVLTLHFIVYKYYIQKNEQYTYSKTLFCLGSIILGSLISVSLLKHGFISISQVLLFCFFSILIHIFFIDLKNHLIPNKLNLILLILSITIIFSLKIDLSEGLLSGVYYVVAFFLFYILARGSFGMGDVKLSFPIGVILGVSNIGKFIVTVLFTGSFIALFLLIFKIKKVNDKIAFGPFMIVSFFYLFLA